MSESKSRRWRHIVTWVTIGAMVLLAFLLREQIMETIKNLGRVNVWALLLLIPLHVASYYNQGNLYRSFFAILGHKFRTRSMYRLALEINFVQNVFPSGGASGFSYVPLRLKKARVTTGQATLVQAMRFMAIFTSFLIVLPLGVFMLALHGRVSNLTILAASTLITLLLVGTALFVFIIGNQRRIQWFFTNLTKVLNRIIHVLRPRHPETISIDGVRRVFDDFHENYMLLTKRPQLLKKPLLYALAFSAIEVASIYSVYLAFGQIINPGAVILAYAVANFAGTVSALPGGIGAYEGLMTIVLVASGVPASVSLPVTVMYRVLNMAIALPQGGFLYYRALHNKPLFKS